MDEIRATGILMEEHRLMERMLDVAEAAATRLERGEPSPPGVFADVVTFFERYVDGCHYRKEEEHLFAALARRGIPVESPIEGGPMGVMLGEHRRGRAYVRAMREESERYAAGTLQDPSKLIATVRGYARLLRQHIRKEDRVLYPFADRMLTEEDQLALLEGCERVEREAMGEHEGFEPMVAKLERNAVQP